VLETVAEAELESQNDLAPMGTVAAGPLIELAAIEVEKLLGWLSDSSDIVLQWGQI
jgi:hypothetical protein